MGEVTVVFFFAAVVLLVALGWALLFLVFRRRLATARRSRVEPRGDGLGVPLVAAFSGWKGVPWVAWASSNINPTLILHPDHVECRVIRTRRKRYEAIFRVDYRETFGTNNVVLEFADSISSFAGNTANRMTARDAISRLSQMGCPLSTRARNLLDG